MWLARDTYKLESRYGATGTDYVLYAGSIESVDPDMNIPEPGYYGEVFYRRGEPIPVKLGLVGYIDDRPLYAVQVVGSPQVFPAVKGSIWYGGDDLGDGGPCDETTELLHVGPFPTGAPAPKWHAQRPGWMDDSLAEWREIHRPNRT